MQLKAGQSHTIKNEATQETALFTIHEFIERRGQFVVYGEVHGYTIHKVRGYQYVPNRPSCFPIFPQEQGAEVVDFMNDLDRLAKVDPLVMLLGDARLPIVNIHRTGVSRNKDAMVGRASELIQVWEEWKRLGKVVPLWFRDIIQAEKTRSQLLD